MAIYFFVLLYWLLLFISGNKHVTRSSLFFAVLPLLLIMGLKSVSVGVDTISYYYRYIGADDMMTVERAASEFGYNMLGYFFHDILQVPFWVYYFVMSLFICSILAIFLKRYSEDIYLSLFIYMTIGLFTMSMSGLRQTIAIYICTIPVIWAKISNDRSDKTRNHKIMRLILGVLLVFLAYTIHNSAIIFLPILFLFDLRLTRVQTIVIMLIAVSSILFRDILVDIMGNFVIERYEGVDLNQSYSKNVLTLLVPIVIGLFCAFVSYPEHGEQRYSKALSLMFVFFALYVVFNNLSIKQNQIARLGFYFMNSGIILLPYSIKKLRGSSRSIVTAVFIVLALFYFYMSTDGGTLGIDHYKFFWQEPAFFAN